MVRPPSVWATLSMAASVSAFWRMECPSQTGVERLDPIMDPGTIADHVHTIHGGGNFGMNTTSADLTAPGSCTSCLVSQDHSAYWTPALYFIYDNGTAVLVQQDGGMLAYYQYLLENVTAYPEGFQMIAGNRNARHFDGPFPDTELSSWPQQATDQHFLAQRAVGFNCLNYTQGRTPEPSLYRHTMPTKDFLDAECKDGLRLELAFPSCGTGAADSPDHKSHMAYPNLVKEGHCPPGFDVHYPFMFFETKWRTDYFVGETGQFVLSHGDPTGAGYHGDFIMGWESQSFLQNALNTCKDDSGLIGACPLFKIQSASDAAQCTFKTPDLLKNDNSKGPRQGLPVNVPIQYGPANATAYPCAGRPGVPTTAFQQSAAPTTLSQAPTVPYSAVDPSKSGIGPLPSDFKIGVLVADGAKAPVMQAEQSPVSSSVISSSSPAAVVQQPSTSLAPPPAAAITEAPSISSLVQAARPPNSVYTSDNKVYEVFLDYTDITVTATVTAVDPGHKHRRHLEKHVHHARP